MAIFNMFRRKNDAALEFVESRRDNLVCFDIYAGGGGGAIGALHCITSPAEALLAAKEGTPKLTMPTTYVIDMDAGSKGIEKMSLTESRLNALAIADENGRAFGYNNIINAAISTRLEGSKGEQTTINDMIADDDLASKHMQNAVLTEEESLLPREVGAQGKPRLVEIWQSSVFKVESVEDILSRILRAFLDGKRVLVRITGSATGATGATFLNSLSQHIYYRCLRANDQLMDNLRIHSIVLLGYAVHPSGEDGDSGFKLDCTEDDLRVLNWYRNRRASGADKCVNRTYFVNAAPALCYDRYARGGDQGRHYCLGDMLCLAAIKDSGETAFDHTMDGYRVFVPITNDERRFGWSHLSDIGFMETYVNYLRFCAAVVLKLKPMTVVSHQEVSVAPHVVKMLGKNAPADMLEKRVITPIQAMINIAEDALRAFMEIGASGTDWSGGVVTLTAEDTTLFNPYAIKSILNGDVPEKEVNAFDPDRLTEYTKGDGTANIVRTDVTVGSAYNEAVSRISRGAQAADFLVEFYRQLSI